MLKQDDLSVFAVSSRYDPTRSLTLRRQFSAQMTKRFRALKGIVRKAIVEQDVLGLKDGNVVVQAELTPPGHQAYAFDRSKDKVERFMEWLKEQEEKGILEVSRLPQLGEAVEQPWTNTYVRQAYVKGIDRARGEMRRAGYNVPSIEDEGGLDAVFNSPFHADKVGLMYTRTFSELKGITESMDQEISRVLAEGISQGVNPNQMARWINSRIEMPRVTVRIPGVGLRRLTALQRARTLARTETIRAHHAAMIQEYKNWQVADVQVKAEWDTAGDHRVCELCRPLDGQIYTIEEIEPMIPRHPNCFLDSQVPVYTSEGWKAIGKIEIDDLVLTHKGRFKKVYALPRTQKQTPNAVQFKFKGWESLSMTSNHPVLVTKPGSFLGRWKQAKDCKAGDYLTILGSFCKRCQKPIPYYRTYCNRTCLSKDITDKQWSDPEHKRIVSEKNRISMLNQYKFGLRDKDKVTKAANKKTRQMVKQGIHPLQIENNREKGRHLTNTSELRKKSSERMRAKNPMFDSKVVDLARQKTLKRLKENPESHPNYILAQRDKRTSIEQKMKDLLDHSNVDYIEQHPIPSPNGGRGKGAYYYVDFAIPVLKIAIECDGDYWHQDVDKDKQRQKDIEDQGWMVLRFSEGQLNERIDEVQDELARVVGNHTRQFSFHYVEIESAEKWQVRKPRTLYNLSVEEDESYLAKGIVVHNCRCIALPVDVSEVGAKQSATQTATAPSSTTSVKPKTPLMSSVGQKFSGCFLRPIANIEVLRTPQSCSDIVRTDDGRWLLQGADEVTDEETLKRLKNMRIPPAWRNVVVAKGPKDKIQAIGLDKAGRWQYRYSAEHIQKQARKKFDRVKSFSRDFPAISRKVDDDIARGEPKAFLLKLEEKTAIRVGSDRDFRAKKKAYGLTTLQKEHVEIDGNKITLNFTAKEGKQAVYEIEDDVLADFLRERAANTKVGEQLFPDVKARDLNDYLKELAENKRYSIKDYRTYFGTKIAYDELKQYAGKELTKADRKKIVKDVSTKVSDFLHNTPTMARNSYIDPMVWEFIGGLP